MVSQTLEDLFGEDIWVNNASHSGDTTRGENGI
jgi:hypothetical protein